MKIAIYTRVSTDDQSCEMQVQELRTLAQARGWTIHAEYTDTVSGASTSRPGLDALLREVQARKVNAVLVWRLDRLGRSTQHLLEVLEVLRENNVEFVSAREAIDTSTPTGRFLYSMLSAFAELEREVIRERVIAGVRAAQAAGKHCGRKEIPIDLQAAQALLASGYSLTRAAKALGVARNTLASRLRGQ